MASSVLDPASDDGFATVAAMAVSLALALGSTFLVIRAAGELRNARLDLERTRAAYALDAAETFAALDRAEAKSDAGLRRIEFGGATSTVRIEEEATKLAPRDAAKLPESWFAALRVADVKTLTAVLAAPRSGRPWTFTQIADLDPSPLWKTCAPEVISPAGGGGGSAFAGGSVASLALPRTIKLTASGEEGYVEERLVQISSDPGLRTALIDRRFYRTQSVQAPACPPPPDLRTAS